jgi:DNA-nicking Smr family endonuclease
LDAARRNGLSPNDVRKLVVCYTDRPGCWTTGGLVYAISTATAAVIAADPLKCFPPPNEAAERDRERLASEKRFADQQARDETARHKSQVEAEVTRQLEDRYGATLDGMEFEQVQQLAARRLSEASVKSLHGPMKKQALGVMRHMLLEALAEEEVEAQELIP